MNEEGRMANSPATLLSQDRSGCYYLHYFALNLYLPVLNKPVRLADQSPGKGLPKLFCQNAKNGPLDQPAEFGEASSMEFLKLIN